MATIANSSFLDLTSWRVSGAATPEAAFGIPAASVHASPTGAAFNVALVLPRLNDPTALLEGDWATRQTTLVALNASGTLWSTYGADPALYAQVVSDLTAQGITVLGAADGYVSSAASRTIWVSLDAAQFNALFGTPILGDAATAADTSMLWWDGELSLPSAWGVTGLWVDWDWTPVGSAMTTGSVALAQGSQSIGNAAGQTAELFPQQIADLYKFPLDASVATGAVGLVEPGIGSALSSGGLAAFNAKLQEYRAVAGVTGSGAAYTQNEAGQLYYISEAGERTLDTAIVGTVVPNSDLYLYAGSGYGGYAASSVFTGYQSAIWQLPDGLSGLAQPAVITSSWFDEMSMSPDSPFYSAYRELMIDAALRNQSVFIAAGDAGSSNYSANGLTNVTIGSMSPYVVSVGGTSLSILAAAQTDTTLSTMLAAAQAGDPAVLWALMAAGLSTLPADLAAGDRLVETVWNTLQLKGAKLEPGYTDFPGTVGGVDVSQPTPWYQTAYGLTPTTTDPFAQTGRGVPDVSAIAGGNMLYTIPNPDMNSSADKLQYWMGTSAATPLWASLYTQFNTIFADQGLPNLGFSNDLLYIAAVIAPGAFNDVTLGNNITSFLAGGSYASDAGMVTPTGFGYEAGAGYDLVSGLGSPNGTLLGRALTTIAHGQMYFDTPDVLGQTVSGGWAATISESLLFQPVLSGTSHVDLMLGGRSFGYDGAASASFAWSSQFAQQVVQADFSPQLVTLFDAQSQATPFQANVDAGAGIGVHLDGAAAGAPQATLSTAYGFVDFISAAGDEAVQVARPLFVAETAGGASDQEAVVRLRQVGALDLDLLFFKLDDYSGTVGGVAPGQAGYEAAVLAHAYSTTSGSTWIDGPGFGAYGQTELAQVNAGDLIAMALTAGGHTYYAFTAANADGVTHLWSYGLNTFGWEDVYGGGDADYNDLIVQLDFTSTTGHGYLV